MIEEGDTCICQYDDWFNAFGEQSHSVHTGMVLTVTRTVMVAGARFLEFEETPDGLQYLATGFTKRARTLH